MSYDGDYGCELLSSLKNAEWNAAARTFGNSHSTWIGLVVTWWISGDPETRWALEASPSYEDNLGYSDAILCQDAAPVGIVEVEGTKPLKATSNISNYFEAKYDELSSLKFAILLVYPYELRGRGQEKRPVFAKEEELARNEITRITRNHPDRLVIYITLHKTFEPEGIAPIRNRRDYYRSKLTRVEGSLHRDGIEIRKLVLWESALIRRVVCE